MSTFAKIRANRQAARAALLPHPDFPSHIKGIILDALRVAWNRVCASIVECKIVDKAHPVSLYSSQGILRFVKGEYAWQMPCSMMVAYAGQGYTVPETLTPHLREHSVSASDRYLTESLPTEDSSFYISIEPRVYISRHKRNWQYEGGRSPGAIDILHVWLPAE